MWSTSNKNVAEIGFPNNNGNSWDDIQVDIGRVRLGSSAPTWRAYNYGISGGVTFDVLGFAVGNSVDFTVQTSHSMLLLSVLDEHIHYCTPTNGTGKKFKFKLDVICAGINDNWVKPDGSPYSAEHSITSDYSNSHKLFGIADVDGYNTTVSSLYKCKLTRIAASADEYSGEIYVDFIDSHYKKDQIGSRQEYVK